MFKPFVNLFCAAAFATAVLAQDVFFASPEPNSNVVAGSDIVIQLGKVVSSTGSVEVAVALGAARCAPECPAVSDKLGSLLYVGSYDPEWRADAHFPYQNFTVVVPTGYTGRMQFGALHCYAIGAGATPVMQLLDMSLNVIAPQ